MSTEYLDLTQYELSTPVNYTQLYNNDMLKIDTNAKKTANNIVSISTDVDSIKNDVIDAENNINSVKNNINTIEDNINTIENDINTIKDDVIDINNSINNINNRIEDLDSYIDNVGNAVDNIRQDIAIIDGNLDAVATMTNDLQAELNAEKQNIAGLNEMIGNIGDRVDMIQPRTERLFFYSVEKNIATSDTLFYNFDTVQLPAFIDPSPNSGYKIHYRITSYTRNGFGILAEFTVPISSAISHAVNNTSVTSYTMYTISGKTYVALYIYIVKALNISIDNNNVLHANIDLESEGHNITFSSTGVSDEKSNSHQAGKLIFSFEIFK